VPSTLNNACKKNVSSVEPLRQRIQPRNNPTTNICTMPVQSYWTCSAAHNSEMMMIAAVVLILVVAALLTRPALRYVRGSDAPERIRFLVNLAETPVPEAVSVSPDGRTIGYASRDGGSSAVFLRSIDSLTAKKIAGTEGASRLFWAPDSSATVAARPRGLERQ